MVVNSYQLCMEVPQEFITNMEWGANNEDALYMAVC